MKNFFEQFINIIPGTGKKQDDTEHKIKTAVCALLLEIAYCDDEFTDDEKKLITEIVKNRFDLSQTESAELITTAERERGKSVDL